MEKRVVLVLGGLVLGAALALVTGRGRAQVAAPGVDARRWEQDCEQTHGVDEARALAKARGESGWELVALDAGVMCFKRPAPPPPKPADPWPGY
ncbi:hypothetical protein SOCE26_028920 [Sorangium cellulosum]|uniref:Uncharacterized protein n=1 Tax=Sorangium cellulosum TaxID=56 RepID=A0A2L0EQA3_SORCE|nr:hypothetical protein [Sorangium cellulosum]AUX41479.1 hypothetical protein SOCE26_028920 [Sorangium cellulosum]